MLYEIIEGKTYLGEFRYWEDAEAFFHHLLSQGRNVTIKYK